MITEQERNLWTLRRFPQPPQHITYLNSSGNPYPEVIQKAIRKYPNDKVCRYAGCPVCKDVPNRNIEIWKCDARIPRSTRTQRGPRSPRKKKTKSNAS